MQMHMKTPLAMIKDTLHRQVNRRAANTRAGIGIVDVLLVGNGCIFAEEQYA
jgi:hypothetical protein